MGQEPKQQDKRKEMRNESEVRRERDEAQWMRKYLTVDNTVLNRKYKEHLLKTKVKSTGKEYQAFQLFNRKCFAENEFYPAVSTPVSNKEYYGYYRGDKNMYELLDEDKYNYPIQ